MISPTLFKRLGVTAALTAGLVSASAHAVPVSGSVNVDFDTGTESLFGPGGSAVGFETSGSVGDSNLGFTYDISASSGSVDSARFDGRINYAYENDVYVDDNDRVSFSFFGDTNGGNFETTFGASIETKYRILGFTDCIYCAGATLDTNDNFRPRLDTTFSDSDRETVSGVEVGPNIGVASATAGVDLDVTQRSNFNASGISGTLRATNRDTGTSQDMGFDILNNGVASLDLGLDEAGLWDISLRNLTLDHEFWSSFTATLTPFVQYTIGAFCGDPGDDSDNSVLCGGDGRADWDLANLSLGSTDRFALGFNRLNLNPFSINVLPPAAVPAPATLGLLGLAGLVLLRRRQRQG